MAQPVAGVKIVPPLAPPQQGQIVTHYEMFQPEAGCCKCEGMKSEGIIAIILLVVFFWPLAWIPCIMPECFEAQQRPIYGYPNGTQQPVPVAQPVHGFPVHPSQGPAPGTEYPKADKPPPV